MSRLPIADVEINPGAAGVRSSDLVAVKQSAAIDSLAGLFVKARQSADPELARYADEVVLQQLISAGVDVRILTEESDQSGEDSD